MLRQHISSLTIRTPGRDLVEITREVRPSVAGSGIREGLLTPFIRHTSASLLIQENADPELRDDLERFFVRLAMVIPCLFTSQRAQTTCRRMSARR